jgi:hypothetical protein
MEIFTMSSDKKIDANRRNAQQSTGPKTPEGKANSRMNAVKHGVLARNTVASGPPLREDWAEFYGLLEGLRAHYDPVGPYEDLLVQEIAAAKWKTIRLERFEAAGVSVRTSEAIAAGRNRIEDERWGLIQKDLRFKLDTAADPAKRPVVTADILRDQMDLVKRLTRDDAIVENEPDFRTFVWLSKTGGDPDGTMSNAEKEEKCRALMAALTSNELDDLVDDFISTMERALQAMWELREKAIPFEAGVEQALVPDDANLEKIIRYSTYLSRLEERKVAMLEHLQAERRKKEGRD